MSSVDKFRPFSREAIHFDSEFSDPLTQGRSESTRVCRKLVSPGHQAAKTPCRGMARTDLPARCTEGLVSWD